MSGPIRRVSLAAIVLLILAGIVIQELSTTGYRTVYTALTLAALLMAVGNWSDHDRSRCHSVHDIAMAHLQSCDHGALLFTYGDNDPFPLWYLRFVEGIRTDIRVENIGLLGTARFAALFDESLALGRPIYFTHYAHDHLGQYYPGRLQLEGNAYRLMPDPCDSVAIEPFLRHLDSMEWHPVGQVYIDETGRKFIEQHWRDILLLAENLNAQGRTADTRHALDRTLAQLPLSVLQDVELINRIGQAYLQADDTASHRRVEAHLRAILTEQLAYYHTMSPARQRAMPYTLRPREELYLRLGQ